MPIVQAGERVGDGVPFDRLESRRLDDRWLHELGPHVEDEVEQGDPLADVAIETPVQLAAMAGHVVPQLFRPRLLELDVRELADPRRVRQLTPGRGRGAVGGRRRTGRNLLESLHHLPAPTLRHRLPRSWVLQYHRERETQTVYRVDNNSIITCTTMS